MPYLFRFRPRPRCLRDQCELWIIRKSDGAMQVFNLAGLIPYIFVPVGLLVGLIVSLVIQPDPVGWGAQVRWVPLLLAPGLGVLMGLVIRFIIIGHHYVDFEVSQEEYDAAQQLLQRAEKPRKKKSAKRRRVQSED